MADRHPGTAALLGFFAYQHLPADLAEVSMLFHHLAHELADRLPDSPELTVGLRKLLEGKDCAVRATLSARSPDGGPPRPLVQSMQLNTLSRTLTVGVACPVEMPVEEVADQVRAEVLDRLQRSGAER